MAVAESPTPAPSSSSSTTQYSISKFIAKLKHGRSSKPKRKSQHGILQDTRPPLIPSPLPLVLPEHQHTLSQLGWTTITIPSKSSNNAALDLPGPHPLQSAYENLFGAAQNFFDMPDDEKGRWKHRLGSEEGWSKIPGEKEFITLRTLAYTPDILKAPAKRYWQLMGAHLTSTLGRISTSLDIPSSSSCQSGDREGKGLVRFVGPCKVIGDHEVDKTSTMLRIFRYESWEPKIVAEAHADLGLLSCVVGDVPGLEVWNGRQFFDIERLYERENEVKGNGGGEEEVGRGGGKATILAGRQLERFSNFRYPAGGHRVVSYGRPPGAQPQSATAVAEKRYRHSIVFVLRAHEPVVVNSEDLETEVTGIWAEPVKDVLAGELYEQIRRKHFNINIGHEEREKQRRKVREGPGNKTGKLSVQGTG